MVLLLMLKPKLLLPLLRLRSLWRQWQQLWLRLVVLGVQLHGLNMIHAAVAVTRRWSLLLLLLA